MNKYIENVQKDATKLVENFIRLYPQARLRGLFIRDLEPEFTWEHKFHSSALFVEETGKLKKLCEDLNKLIKGDNLYIRVGNINMGGGKYDNYVEVISRSIIQSFKI